MGLHTEVMKEMDVSRSDYLRAIRRQQPIAELERKANKAKRKGFWTQEDRDLACAEAMQLIAELGWGNT